MRQRMAGLFLSIVILLGAIPAAAQVGPDAHTAYELNLRAGPGTGFEVISVLPAGTGLVFEGRTADMGWLLGHTADGSARGWVSGLYLNYRAGFNAAHLPLSDEVIPVQAAPQPANEPPPPDAPANAAPGNVTVAPNNIPARVHDIYQHGQELGHRPASFIKLGDSVTVQGWHLTAFAGTDYDLGGFGYLQDTINFFRPSGAFNQPNLTAESGYTCASVLDATWSNPELCQAGETPLACEIRRKQPSIAIIYFGPNDMRFMTVGQYESHMSRIVRELIDRGVIPILTTFAIAPNQEPDKAPAFLQVIRHLAAREQIPLIEFHDAANALPNYGVLPDGYHLSFRNDWFISFNGDQNHFGVTLRDLLTLQMLDDLRRTVIQGG